MYVYMRQSLISGFTDYFSIDGSTLYFVHA